MSRKTFPLRHDSVTAGYYSRPLEVTIHGGIAWFYTLSYHITLTNTLIAPASQSMKRGIIFGMIIKYNFIPLDSPPTDIRRRLFYFWSHISDTILPYHLRLNLSATSSNKFPPCALIVSVMVNPSQNQSDPSWLRNDMT